MEMLLARSLILLVTLSSCYATRRHPAHCEDEKLKALKELVETQRITGDALTKILQTQQQKDDEVSVL